MRKMESRQQGPPAKKAKLDEVLAAHCRADLVTECMKKKKNTNIIFICNSPMQVVTTIKT